MAQPSKVEIAPLSRADGGFVSNVIPALFPKYQIFPSCPLLFTVDPPKGIDVYKPVVVTIVSL